MTNYVKTTNFTAKDSLISGDPGKLVKGYDFDVEFDALVTAVGSKADSYSGTFTGIPTAPTATVTTDTTQIATTAFVQAVMDNIYPVGAIYTSTSSSLPSVLSALGTWEAFGAGKVLVGQDTGDASFDTLEETGGSKDAIVVSHTHSATLTGTSGSSGGHSHTYSGTTGTESASHTHSGTTSTGGDHYHGVTGTYNASGGGGGFSPFYVNNVTQNTTTAGSHNHTVTTGTESATHTHSYSGTTSTTAAHTHSLSVSGTTGSTGSSGTNANLQPYVVVKMWKRTA